MEDSTRVIRNITTVGIGAEFVSMLYDMRWFFIVMAILIFADYHFGKAESKKRYSETGDERYRFHFSRAVRRTFNKSMDYLCWVLMSGIFAQAFSAPFGIQVNTIAAIICLLAAACELSSIFGHFCYLRGIPYRFDVRRFFICLAKKKDRDVGDAIEQSLDTCDDDAPSRDNNVPVRDDNTPMCDDNAPIRNHHSHGNGT